MLRGLVFSWPKALSFVVLFCVLSALAGMIGAQESSLRFARSGLIGFMLSDFCALSGRCRFLYYSRDAGYAVTYFDR